MDHYKMHIRKTYPRMNHFLTYADNYAVGYFEKQGFSKEITLDRSVWAGYIKDYEGGTIMQCTMLDKVDYLDKANILAQQQDAIMSKVRQMSRSHIVHAGLPQFQEGAPVGVTVDPQDVPGLRAPVSLHLDDTRLKYIQVKLDGPRPWLKSQSCLYPHVLNDIKLIFSTAWLVFYQKVPISISWIAY